MSKIWRLTVLTVILAAALTGCGQPAGPDQAGQPTVPPAPTTTAPPPATTPAPPAAPVLAVQRFVRITNVIPLPGYAYRGDGADTRVGPATLVLDDRSRLDLVANATVVETCQLLVPPWATSTSPCWAVAHMAGNGQVVGLRLFRWDPRDNGQVLPFLGGESTVQVVDGKAVLADGTWLQLTDATQYACPPAIVDGLKSRGTTIPGGSIDFMVDGSLTVTLVECHLPF